MPVRIASAAIERASVAALPPAANDRTNIVDVVFEPVTFVSAPPANAVSSVEAAADVIMTLESERRAAVGDYNHRHVATDCAFCRRAVAAYR